MHVFYERVEIINLSHENRESHTSSISLARDLNWSSNKLSRKVATGKLSSNPKKMLLFSRLETLKATKMMFNLNYFHRYFINTGCMLKNQSKIEFFLSWSQISLVFLWLGETQFSIKSHKTIIWVMKCFHHTWNIKSFENRERERAHSPWGDYMKNV